MKTKTRKKCTNEPTKGRREWIKKSHVWALNTCTNRLIKFHIELLHVFNWGAERLSIASYIYCFRGVYIDVVVWFHSVVSYIMNILNSFLMFASKWPQLPSYRLTYMRHSTMSEIISFLNFLKIFFEREICPPSRGWDELMSELTRAWTEKEKETRHR